MHSKPCARRIQDILELLDASGGQLAIGGNTGFEQQFFDFRPDTFNDFQVVARPGAYSGNDGFFIWYGRVFFGNGNDAFRAGRWWNGNAA